MEFKVFSKAVHERLVKLSEYELFVVGDDNREFERVYLAAFPEGTNPVYRANTEHDCSCCKNFIRNFGRVVALVNGVKMTVWGVDVPEPYATVAHEMDHFVRGQKIVGPFRTKERTYGVESTRELLDNGQVHRWDHFYGEVVSRHHSATPDAVIGEFNTGKEVFLRGLTELKASALQEVASLIESKELYRGEEHEAALRAFSDAYVKYARLKTDADREVFVWSHAREPFSRFRNTVIGTLVQDLSAEMDVEDAVKAFETKVAPTNYIQNVRMLVASMYRLIQVGLALGDRHAPR